MIRVIFREPQSAPWYERWKKRARRETAQALRAWRKKQGESYEPRRGLWGVKQLKAHLTELFHGKCAYCEARFVHVSWGDVEHYRPKKAVREDPAHGGYYWLAYDLRNLLLACDKCNREGGKLDQFPIEGQHMRHPRHIEQEQPLLLSPYREEDLRQHFRFFTHFDGKLWGNVVGATERGKKTIEVCRLHRNELVEARQKVQERVILRLMAYVNGWVQAMTPLAQPGEEEAAKNKIFAELARLKEGKEEFSASVLTAAETYLEKLALTPPASTAAR